MRNRTRPPGLATTLLLASSALAFSAPGANLLPNGGFATDLSGWEVVAPVTWSPDGDRSPGAAQLQGTFGGIGVPALRTCAAVQPGLRYDLTAVGRVPYDPASVGGLSIRLLWHQSPSCASDALGGGADLDVDFRGAVAWQTVRAEGIAAPEGAASASVVVLARSGGKPARLYLDDVSLEPVPGATTLIVPTAANVPGAGGERFQSDLYVRNPENVARSFVLRLRCAVEVPCNSSAINYPIGARETRVFPNVLGTEFGRDPFASAIEIEYDPAEGPLRAFSRATTRHPANPGNGMSVPARAQAQALTDALFLGLSGAEPSASRRVNAGVMNPGPAEATIAFAAHDGDGRLLGTVVRRVAPGAWLQLNDLFAAAGASLETTRGAFASFASSRPVHPFVIAIDSTSGDPTWVPPVNDPQIP